MLANGLSMARMFLAPAVAFSLFRDEHGTGQLTLVLMLTAGATDLLDGWTARRLGQTSNLGRILDPLADKVFIGTVCISLVVLRGFPLWLVALQATRDLAIVGFGSFLLRSRHLVVPASMFGKVATWAMAITILGHVLRLEAPWPSLSHGVTALMIVGSGAGYARWLSRIMRAPAQLPSAGTDASSSSRTEA
jgi:CDP-diacylglycerol--glycerol-3-phosphate 3-phosphatidyltransferase